MIDHTFLHLPGIGESTERRIWQSGIYTWEDFLQAPQSSLPIYRSSMLKERLEESIHHRNDLDYFRKTLPPLEHWRLYRDFREGMLYLDIETDGRQNSDSITAICTYDGENIRNFVRGENLDDAVEVISRAKLLVTFYGRKFDLPMINLNFQLDLDPPHMDLFQVFRSLQIKGGLKKIEKHFGLSRNELDGVDGYFAVLFWRYWRNMGDRRALDTLLAYNVEDVVNLEPLAIIAYNEKIRVLGLPSSLSLEAKKVMHVNPYPVSMEILQLVREYLDGLRY